MIGANVNGIRIEELFNCYDKYNFLYQEKKEKMRHLFPMIKANWSMAMEMPWEYFLLLTYNRPDKDLFASVSAWRSTSRSYCIQHMVSNQPENTRLILLHFLDILKEDIRENNAIQVFYQPKTRFANNMFSYLSQTAGPQHSCLRSYSFVGYKPKPIPGKSSNIFAEALNENNRKDILHFVQRERGEFYSWVQDLDSDDFELSQLDVCYRQYGLTRTRKIIAYRNERNEILGVTISGKASSGLNFSLLENASELILCSEKPIWILNEVVSAMLVHLSNEYQNSGLEQLPLLVNPEYEDLIKAYGGAVMRTYNYFTCDNSALESWSQYLIDELAQVNEHLRIKNESIKAS